MFFFWNPFAPQALFFSHSISPLVATVSSTLKPRQCLFCLPRGWQKPFCFAYCLFHGCGVLHGWVYTQHFPVQAEMWSRHCGRIPDNALVCAAHLQGVGPPEVCITYWKGKRTGEFLNGGKHLKCSSNFQWMRKSQWCTEVNGPDKSLSSKRGQWYI